MAQFRKILIALLVLVSLNAIRGEEIDDAPKKTIEFPSPDGRFAFRYSGGKSEDEVQTYDLIDKASRKVVTKVAQSDPDAGPSTRFTMEKCFGDQTRRRSPLPRSFGNEELLSSCLRETVPPFARSNYPTCRSKSRRRK